MRLPPLAEESTSPLLAWIVLVMVYLAVLAAISALVLTDLATRWQNGLTGTLTVEIAPGPEETEGDPETAPPPALAQRVELALALLRTTPGVRRATAVTTAQLYHLLEPWLGTELPNTLPLPALIEVEIATGDGAPLDLDALGQSLAMAIPGARLDQPTAWLADLHQLGQTLRGVALLMVTLVFGAALAAVVVTVRAGLARYGPVVELLHLMGATDPQVARPFERHVLKMALLGGAGGALLAFATLTLLHQAADGTNFGLLSALSATPLPGLTLLAPLLGVPALLAALAVGTARWTVLQALAALP